MLDTIHLEPVQYIIRIYDQKAASAFEDNVPFIFVGTLHIINRTTGYLYAMHGKLTKETLRQLQVAFYNMGLTKIISSRHGKEKEWSPKNYILTYDQDNPALSE